MSNLKIKQLFDYDTWTYTYLLWDESSRKSIIIDPVLEQLDRDVNLINKLNLRLMYIFETHVHADHITAASKLKKSFNAKIKVGSDSNFIF